MSHKSTVNIHEIPSRDVIISYSSAKNANVAELADALDLGSSGRKAMGVRPSPFAPQQSTFRWFTQARLRRSTTYSMKICTPLLGLCLLPTLAFAQNNPVLGEETVK